MHIKHSQKGLVHRKHLLLAIMITESEFKFKFKFKALCRLWLSHAKKKFPKVWNVSWVFEDLSII